MTGQTRTVTAEVIIKLFFKHPDLQYPAECWYFYPNQQEKELLEFLLGDQLLAKENGLGWTIEYQVALAICLKELAKQSPEFFNQFLPEIQALKAKLKKMASKKTKMSHDEQKHQGYSLLKKCLEEITNKLYGQTLTIIPFAEENKLSIRKKIIVLALIRSGINRYHLSPEINKLLKLVIHELGIDPKAKINYI